MRQIAKSFTLTTSMFLLTVAFAALHTFAQVPSVRIAQYTSNVVGTATFDPTDMPYRSVLAGTASGELHEIFYSPNSPTQKGDSILGYFTGITALAGFYAANDQYRIAIVATQDGSISELFYHPTKGRGRSVIASFPGLKIVSLAAFYNTYDAHRVVFAALSNGSVKEINYHPSTGVKIFTRLNAAPGYFIAVAGNPVYGGQNRRLLVSTSSGLLYEYWINNSTNVISYHQTIISSSLNPLYSVATNGSFIVGEAPRVGAGFVFSNKVNPILNPGVTSVAADSAGRNYNNFIWSFGTAVYTSNWITY